MHLDHHSTPCACRACLVYLQPKILHPLVDGRGDGGLRLPQDFGALLTASQEPGVIHNIQGPSSHSHLAGQPARTSPHGCYLKHQGYAADPTLCAHRLWGLGLQTLQIVGYAYITINN